MTSLTLDSVQLDLILDATLSISGDSVFAYASRTEWSAHVSSAENGSISVPVRPLLIRGPDGVTLVDTGLGCVEDGDGKESSIGHTYEELARFGVSAAEIDRVIITHGHGDHIQGNTRRVDGSLIPAFPNAEYVIQEVDAEALRIDSPREWSSYFEPVVRDGRLRLISGNVKLSENISCLLTRGHTIGHQSVVISDGERSACFLGDLAIHILNLQHPDWGPDWAWSRDFDRQNRVEICEWAQQTGGILILPHDAEHSYVAVDRNLKIRALNGDPE